MARPCDACNVAPCTLYCNAESTYLCNDCDGWIHAANSSASSHQRNWICTACENAPAAVTCKADAAYLCSNCDVEIHSVNALARRHYRVPVSPLPGVRYESSNCYQDDDDDASGLNPENRIMGNTMINEEIDEDEAYSWLLLEPDSNENQTNSGFTSHEPFDDDYVNLRDLRTEYQHQEQYSQLQSSCVFQEDSVIPDKSFEVSKQTQQQGENQQQSCQQEQTLYFNKEQEASKSAFINRPLNNRKIPVSFPAASMIPNASGYNIPSSYLTFQNGTTDSFPNPPLLMSPQFTPLNREEKVLRYREKRKARKFEKKIRYASRKAYAETRPRVKGRFASKTDLEFDKNQLFSKEEYGYGVVPSL